MDFWTLVITIACGIAVAQSFFLSAYLFFKNEKVAAPIFFLSAMLFFMALRIGKTYFYYVFTDYFAAGKTICAAALWAIGPSFLLYVLASKPVSLKTKHYLHFLPPILVIVGGIGMDMPIGRFYFWGAFVFVAYFLWGLYIYHYQDWRGNKKRFTLFSTCAGLICLCFVVQALTGSKQVYGIGSVVSLVIMYVVNFLILKDQNYLKAPTIKNKKVDSSQVEKIVTALEKLFEQEKIYRQKGLTLAAVSKSISFPSYQVSKSINQHFGTKFNRFVNQYRIKEAKSRLQDIKQNDKIEVIAKEVGFSSTSSLYTAFKKEMNVTPQVYRKQLSENRKEYTSHSVYTKSS